MNAAAILLLEEIEHENLDMGFVHHIHQAPERVLRDRLDLLNIPDTFLIRYYRFPRHVILEMCNILNQPLSRPTRRSRALPVQTQVLVALRFYASGTFQNALADVVGISQTSCSRAITAVSEALTNIAPQYFRYSIEDAEFVARVKAGIYAMHGFPNAIGMIDGTLINIKGPSEDEAAFVDRYRNHSLNCIVICDADLRVMHLIARWPGSAHDQFVWSQSLVKQQLDDGVVPSGWLIGDSGFALDQHMMVPIRNPVTPAESNYNECLKRTRSANERCIGVAKSCFRCIHESGGTLQYTPVKCTRIITCAFLLHNWRIERRIPFDDNMFLNEERAAVVEIGLPRNIVHNQHAAHVRQQLIDNVFRV